MAHPDDDTKKVRELAEKIGFCVLPTQSGLDLRARPMSAYSERDVYAFFFLTDVARHKDEEVARHPDVCL